jgi:hypothetical protein
MILAKNLRRLAIVVATAAMLSAGLTTAAHAGNIEPGQPAGADAATAARSVAVTFKNFTALTLTRSSWSMSHGIWTVLPPETIQPVTSAFWKSESNGFATGTEGRVTYNTASGTVRVTWNNPYVGSNGYSCQVPAGFTCNRLGGSGNNANVTFLLNVNI